jgi:trk system potassium uptake protein TrkA
MRAIIIGCGRVGARVASELDQRGEHVTVIDVDARAFNRLPQSFGGETVRGNGTDEDVLRGAGAEQADLLMTLTEGDNRNALAAQLGKHTFGISRVIAKVNDPLRAEAYRALGLQTICRTIILGDALVTAAIEGAEATNGFVEPATAEPLRGGAPHVDTLTSVDRPVAPSGAHEPSDAGAVVTPTDGQDGGL